MASPDWRDGKRERKEEGKKGEKERERDCETENTDKSLPLTEPLFS